MDHKPFQSSNWHNELACSGFKTSRFQFQIKTSYKDSVISFFSLEERNFLGEDKLELFNHEYNFGRKVNEMIKAGANRSQNTELKKIRWMMKSLNEQNSEIQISGYVTNETLILGGVNLYLERYRLNRNCEKNLSNALNQAFNEYLRNNNIILNKNNDDLNQDPEDQLIISEIATTEVDMNEVTSNENLQHTIQLTAQPQNSIEKDEIPMDIA